MVQYAIDLTLALEFVLQGGSLGASNAKDLPGCFLISLVNMLGALKLPIDLLVTSLINL